MQQGEPVFDTSKLTDGAWAHAPEAAETSCPSSASSKLELCISFQKSFSGREWRALVESEIEFQDIDAGFTEKT